MSGFGDITNPECVSVHLCVCVCARVCAFIQAFCPFTCIIVLRNYISISQYHIAFAEERAHVCTCACNTITGPKQRN